MYTKYLLLVVVFLFVLPTKISIGSSFKTESEITKTIAEKQINEKKANIIKDFVDQHGEHTDHQNHDEKEESLEYHFNRVPDGKFKKWICGFIHFFLAFLFNLVILISFKIPDQPLWYCTPQIHATGSLNNKSNCQFTSIKSYFCADTEMDLRHVQLKR